MGNQNTKSKQWSNPPVYEVDSVTGEKTGVMIQYLQIEVPDPNDPKKQKKIWINATDATDQNLKDAKIGPNDDKVLKTKYPIDCVVNDWSEWFAEPQLGPDGKPLLNQTPGIDFGKPLFTGNLKRTRKILQHPQNITLGNGAKICPSLEEYNYLSNDCTLSEWGEWIPATPDGAINPDGTPNPNAGLSIYPEDASLGYDKAGKRMRKRTYDTKTFGSFGKGINGGKDCERDPNNTIDPMDPTGKNIKVYTTQYDQLQSKDCIPGNEWIEDAETLELSKNPDYVKLGKKVIKRKGDIPAKYGGSNIKCVSPNNLQEVLYPVDCVPGEWNNWSNWSQWSNPDPNTGIKTRNRSHTRNTTNDTQPLNGGLSCDSNPKYTQYTNNNTNTESETESYQLDPVDCQLAMDLTNNGNDNWSISTDSNDVINDKNNGTITKIRNTSNDKPAKYGGKSCDTLITEKGGPNVVNRNVQQYPVDCIMNDWTAWNAWGTPDPTTGIQTRTRTRTIQSLPKNGGLSCPSGTNGTIGSTETETETYTKDKVDCIPGITYTWADNGNGTIAGTRTGDIQPKYGGKVCPPNNVNVTYIPKVCSDPFSMSMEFFTTPISGYNYIDYVVPTGVKALTFRLWGGGGTGARTENNPSIVNMGLGGSYVRKSIYVVPGDHYALVVGNGAYGHIGGGNDINNTYPSVGCGAIGKSWSWLMNGSNPGTGFVNTDPGPLSPNSSLTTGGGGQATSIWKIDTNTTTGLKTFTLIAGAGGGAGSGGGGVFSNYTGIQLSPSKQNPGRPAVSTSISKLDSTSILSITETSVYPGLQAINFNNGGNSLTNVATKPPNPGWTYEKKVGSTPDYNIMFFNGGGGGGGGFPGGLGGDWIGSATLTGFTYPSGTINTFYSGISGCSYTTINKNFLIPFAPSTTIPSGYPVLPTDALIHASNIPDGSGFRLNVAVDPNEIDDVSKIYNVPWYNDTLGNKLLIGKGVLGNIAGNPGAIMIIKYT